MPILDPYQSTPEAFTEAMWKEAAGSWRAGGENVFNKRSGEASLVGYVPSVALKAAMRFFLGYEQVQLANVDITAPGGGVMTVVRRVLCRKNPIRHPYYDQLWCTGCGELEFKLETRNNAGVGGTIAGIGRSLKTPSAPVRIKTPAALQNRTGFRFTKLMLRFGPVMYDVREDDDADLGKISNGRAEFLRNVALDWDPRTETFETKVPWKFAEGAASPGFSNPKGVDVIAERAQILVKPDLVAKWTDVPERWLISDASAMPTNILSALGTVNSTDFFRLKAGTLLFLGAKLTRNPWTLLPPFGVGVPDLESRYLYDVELMFSFFDPPKGFLPGPVEITTDRGHNNFLYRGLVVPILPGVSDGNAVRWFLATTTGLADGGQLYQKTPFQRIFDCANNAFP